MEHDLKIVFITGTRADYGKIKPLISRCVQEPGVQAYIFVCGMHLLEQFGSTYHEVLKDGFPNVHIAKDIEMSTDMSVNLGRMILSFSAYVDEIKPDLIVVHGDRIDALGGASVGALKNVRVAHIEGGEVSGTIDDSLRHSISKLAHVHFVSNEEAQRRLLQLGENPGTIHVIGSPDIDIMLSADLPTLEQAKRHYGLTFDQYAILAYHPVTTETECLGEHLKELVAALKKSELNYVVVLPNNDSGSELILKTYKKELYGNPHFAFFPSLRFEFFLTLLKNASFMIGNSSAGIRETSCYGVPTIDLGTRQARRYDPAKTKNILHIEENEEAILEAISKTPDLRIVSSPFGKGDSAERFIEIIRKGEIFQQAIQKKFVDIFYD